MKSIAVIHAGAIGDLVQTLPALHGVRRRWPRATVTLIGRPERAALAILAGAADAAADLDGAGLWRLGHDPAAPLPRAIAGANLVIDFLGTVAEALARRTGGQAASGTLPQVVQLAPLPPPGWDRPASDWISEQMAQQLGIVIDGPPQIPVPLEAMAAARRLLQSRGIIDPFIAIHPGSGSVRKNWPIDRFAAVAARLRAAGRTVAWLVGPAEVERGTLQTRNLPDRQAGSEQIGRASCRERV
jgi:heptosyltransferase-3